MDLTTLLHHEFCRLYYGVAMIMLLSAAFLTIICHRHSKQASILALMTNNLVWPTMIQSHNVSMLCLQSTEYKSLETSLHLHVRNKTSTEVLSSVQSESKVETLLKDDRKEVETLKLRDVMWYPECGTHMA